MGSSGHYLAAMTALVLFVAGNLTISKALDCLTTLVRITHVSEEQNPIARTFMKRLGIRLTIIIVFVITCLIVALTTALALSAFAPDAYRLGFVAVGAFVSLVQYAVALSNWRQKTNLVTRALLRFAPAGYRLINRLGGRVKVHKPTAIRRDSNFAE